MSLTGAFSRNHPGSKPSRKIYPYRRVGKRVFDIVFTLAVAPFVAPLILIFMVLIRRDGGGAFFNQTRIGRKGQHFTCYKLRTMVPNAEKALQDLCEKNPDTAEEWQTFQKLSADPRITPIGQFLRATSLDELPQFWNVFIGDMSIIGPRPFMPNQQALYSQDLSAAYYQLRPGISGAWQVSARNDTSFAGRVAFDEAYYAELSFGADLMTIARTVGVVLSRKGQ